MKTKLLLGLFFLNLQLSFAQNQPTELDSTDFVVSEHSVIQNQAGKKFSLSEIEESLNQGTHTLEPILENQKLSYFLYRKSTAKELAEFEQMVAEEMNMGANLLNNPIAPDTLTDINGKTWFTNSQMGKITVLNFWFTSCPPCISEMPTLNQVKNHFSNQSNQLVFGSVTFNTAKEVATFLKKHPFNWRPFVKAGNFISKLKIRAFPTTLIVNKKGVVVEVIQGLESNQELKQTLIARLEAMLN